MKYFLQLSFCLILVKAHGQQANISLPKDSLRDNHLTSSMGIYLGCNATFTSRFVRNGNQHFLGTSLMYGAFGNFAINDKWQIETGLGAMEYDAKYLRFGFSLQAEDTTKFGDQLINTAVYATIPFIFKYFPVKKHTLCFGVRVSGEAVDNQSELLGYKTGSKYFETTEIGGAFQPIVNKFDIGLILGYEYHSNDHFFASLSANAGLIPFIRRYFINQVNSESNPYQSSYFYPAVGNYNNSLSLQLSNSFLTWDSQNHIRRPLFPSM